MSSMATAGAWRLRLLLYAVVFYAGSAAAAEPDGGPDGVDGLPDGRAPRITEHPVAAVAPRQLPATLSCKADGRPTPNVTWTKDGEPVSTNGPRVMTLHGGSLFFLSVDGADAGVYRCVAANALGQAVSKDASLEVAYLKPDFRAVPESQSAKAGESVVLTCSPPRGRPEPTVTWRKNGRPLEHLADHHHHDRQRLRLVDGGSLAIRDARPSDSGRYQCVAGNVAGTKETAEVYLEVSVPPRLVAGPVDSTALVGSSVVLRCEVAGEPEPEVRWRRGNGMPPATPRAHLLADRSLRIANVRLSDAGLYVCEADNPAGAVSASATLHVVSEPTLSPPPPKVLRLEPGSRAALRCGARGVPPPLVTWALMGNRTALLPGQRLDRLSVSLSRDADRATAVVSLENVTRADSGRVLVCAAVNPAGAAVSRTRLLVLPAEQWPPPVVVAGPSNQTLPLHSTATLACRTAAGHGPAMAGPAPRSAIAWYKDGQLLPAPGPGGGGHTARVHVADSGSLEIQDLLEGDAGEYACVASSRSGRYRWRGWLRVAAEGAPAQRAPEAVALPGAPSLRLANASASSSLTLTWQRNTKVGSSSLLGYQVEVLSRPADGSASAPETPTWAVAARLPASASSYTLSAPDERAAYTFLVRAQNSHGLSPPSELVGPAYRDEAGRWALGQAWSQAWSHGDARDAMAAAEGMDAVEEADVQDALELAPVVRLKEVVVASATSVKVLWDVLDPDQVEGLSVYWLAEPGNRTEGATEASPAGPGDEAALQSLVVQTQPAASSPLGLGLGLGFLVTGLRCFTAYNFFLVPFNQHGEGRPSNSFRARTLAAPPSAPPTRIEATLINGSTALVKWAPPPSSFQNGPLLSYQVVVQAGDPPELVSNVTLSTLSQSASLADDGGLQLLLSNLSQHSAYFVSVAAATTAGLGPLSAPITVRPTAPLHNRHGADSTEGGGGGGGAAGGSGSELLTETWFMALLGSMVAVMVLLFSAIIFLHRRQHRANKETFLGFYDCGQTGPMLTTPLTLKASEGMPHPLSAPLSPPLCLVPQDTYGAKYRAVGVSASAAAPHDALMLPEYAEANDAQYEGSLSQGSTSSKSYYAEVRNPHLLSTFQSASHLGGSQHGSQHGSQPTGSYGRGGCGGSEAAPYGPYATTTLVCSARTGSTAPCSSSSTSWSQDNERTAYPRAAYSDPDSRPAAVHGATLAVGVPGSPSPRVRGLGAPSAQSTGHYDNYNFGSHPGSPSPLDHRDAAAALSLQSRGGSASSAGSGQASLSRENRRLKLLRRQLNRSVHAKGLPPTQGGPQSSQLQLLLRSSPSSCGSGSNQGGSPDDGPSEAADATDALVGGPTGPMGPAGKAQGLRQEVCDYHSGGSSSSRRYGSNSSSSSGGGRSRPPVVAYSGLLRRDT